MSEQPIDWDAIDVERERCTGVPSDPAPAVSPDRERLREEVEPTERECRFALADAATVLDVDSPPAWAVEYLAQSYAQQLAALLAERDELARKVAAVEAEIVEEEEYAEEYPAWEITVSVPLRAGVETVDRIFDAVADAAYDALPGERDGWDVFVSATKQPRAVPVHLLRRILEKKEKE